MTTAHTVIVHDKPVSPYSDLTGPCARLTVQVNNFQHKHRMALDVGLNVS